jgi:hypothetical protein
MHLLVELFDIGKIFTELGSPASGQYSMQIEPAPTLFSRNILNRSRLRVIGIGWMEEVNQFIAMVTNSLKDPAFLVANPYTKNLFQSVDCCVHPDGSEVSLEKLVEVCFLWVFVYQDPMLS